MRQKLISIFSEAVKEISPRKMISDNTSLRGDQLSVCDEIFDLGQVENIFVIAIGKAAHPLTAGLEQVLGNRIESGTVLSNVFFEPLPGKYRCLLSTHPLPSEQNTKAADIAIQQAEDAGENDLVICLVSGGGSAIFSCPVEAISVKEKALTVELLLKAGAPINELNAVRKHLSRVKGGQFLRSISPAKSLSLYLSDVPGDDLNVIASGPTVEDPTTFQDALEVVNRWNIAGKLPKAVLQYLQGGCDSRYVETLKPGEIDSAKVSNILLGKNLDMLLALEKKFRDAGFWVSIDPDHFQGEANQIGKSFAEKALNLKQALPDDELPFVFVRGGETTVRVKGDGLGGRNTELALAAAIALDGTENCYVLAAGTDGKDGPTDAAGAVADGTSILRANEAGLDARKILLKNDSYNFFEPIGDLIITGPTGTNLMDVAVAIVTK